MTDKKPNSMTVSDADKQYSELMQHFDDKHGIRPEEVAAACTDLLDAEQDFLDAFMKLPTLHRELLHAVVVMGMTYAESARHCGIPADKAYRLKTSNQFKTALRLFAKKESLRTGISKAQIRAGMLRTFEQVSDPNSKHFHPQATAAIGGKLAAMEGHDISKQTAASEGNKVTIYQVNTGVSRQPISDSSVELIEGEISSDDDEA